jgi:anti-sigma factor ChrR (cupin superfamily)
MSNTQTFTDVSQGKWAQVDFLPGVELLSLAQPVPEGSIHLARLKAGTTIPAHTHPGDEYVYVLSGTVKTGLTVCPAGTFWRTPAGVRQGPHVALTDAQIMTIRMGAMGSFDDVQATNPDVCQAVPLR